MGRPPIGERAMTAAEKQRRYRDKRRVGRAARIRELEAQLARARKELGQQWGEVVTKLAQGREGVIMPKRLYRQVLGYLSPDRAAGHAEEQARMTKCFQEFSALPVTLVDEVTGRKRPRVKKF